MGYFNVTDCEIDGVKVLEPKRFHDERGWFAELWHQADYQKAGVDAVFVQDNCAYSKRGVLRGLHFQKEHPQKKLIQVLNGEIYDVAVDIREESLTYRHWFGVRLSEENGRQLYLPEGMAHGYLVLSEEAKVLYKCSAPYHPDDEAGILWDDRKIGIQWPIEEGMEIILSEKDRSWRAL